MGDIKITIANNIGFYRKKNGLTQSQLAKKIGVKTTTVSTWERGASSPDIEMLYTLCKLFRISPDLMYGVNTENEHTDNSAVSSRQTYNELITCYIRSKKQLSQKEKMQLAGIILSEDDE